MRTGIILGIRPDGTSELLSGTEVPIHKQKERFKELMSASSKEFPKGFSEFQLWESGGGLRKTLRVRGAEPVRHPQRTPQPSPQKQQSAKTAKPVPSPAPTAQKPPDARAELEKLSDEELLKVVEDLKVEVPPEADRAGIIDLILSKTDPPK